jgi:hypothetical protein
MCRFLPRSVIAPLLLAALLLPIVIVLTAGMSYCLVALDDAWGATALRYLTVAFVILWIFDFILLVLTLGVFALESYAEYEECEGIEEETSTNDDLIPDAQESSIVDTSSDQTLPTSEANAATPQKD